MTRYFIWGAGLAGLIVSGCSAEESASPEEPADEAIESTPTTGTARSSVVTCDEGQANTPPPPTVDYKSGILADGPVGYWRLGERVSTIGHDSNALVPPNDGAYINGPWLDHPGAVAGDRDGAPFFNYAQRPYLRVENNAAQQITGDMTLEAWFTIPTNAQTLASPVVKTSVNMADGYGFFFYPYKMSFYVSNSTFAVSVPLAAEPTTARFHHIVGTYNRAASKLTLYFDGVKVDEKVHTVLGAPIAPGSGPLNIGRGYAENLNWHGSVDEVALYDKALDAARVRAHYHAGLGDSPVPQTTPTGAGTSGTYAYQVAVAANASADLFETATDLAKVLSSIDPSPTAFTAVKTSSPAADSIRLVRYGDATYQPSPGAEQNLNTLLAQRDLLGFFAFSDPAQSGLRIVGKSDSALQAGASYYLRLLGARFLLPDARPNPRWTLLPSRASVRWNVARIESPDFPWMGSFFGTGQGEHGGTFAPEGLLQSLSNPPTTSLTSWKVWKNRNMLVSAADGNTVGRQMGQDFNRVHLWDDIPANGMRDPFDTMGDSCAPGVTNPPARCAGGLSHPEWRAQIPDPQNPSQLIPVPLGSDPKKRPFFHWHIHGNTPFKDYFASRMIQDLNYYVGLDPSGRFSQTISTERTDGAMNEDTLPTGVTHTDTAVELANAMAKKIALTYPSPRRYANFLAYNNHAAPPSPGVTLEPNVMVVVAADAFNFSGLAGDSLFAAWRQHTPNLFAHLVLAPTDNTISHPLGRLPVVDPFVALPKRLRYWRSIGVFGEFAESTLGTGTSGFAWYLIPQLLWNTKTLEDDLLQSTFDQAFGPASPQMTTLFKRWGAYGVNRQRNELAIALEQINAALAAAAPSTDPGHLQRVTDFAAFVHFLVLATEGNVNATALYLWQIHDRQVVQTHRLWELYAKPAVSEWTGAFLSDCEVRALVQSDSARYVKEFMPASYGPGVIPAGSPPTGNGEIRRSTPSLSGAQGIAALFHVQTGGQGTTLSFDMRNKTSQQGLTQPARVVVTAPDGSTVLDATYESPAQFGTPPQWWHRNITFNTPLPGTYVLRIRSASTSGATVIAVAEKIPFAVSPDFYVVESLTESDQDPPGGFAPTSYFYVPPGTVKFDVYGGGSPVPQLCSMPELPTPGGCTPERQATGSITVTVGPGEGGKIWSISNFKGALTFSGIPGLLSPSRAQVLTLSTLPN